MSAVMALIKFCLSAIIKGLHNVQRNTFHDCVGEILNGKLLRFFFGGGEQIPTFRHINLQ